MSKKPVMMPGSMAFPCTALLTEDDVVAGCLLLAPRLGCRLWRNNSGAFRDKTGRLVRFGLGHVSARQVRVWASPDLIGVRCGDGRLLAFECKEPGWNPARLNAHEQAQANCLMDMARCGAIAAFVTDPEQLRRLVE